MFIKYTYYILHNICINLTNFEKVTNITIYVTCIRHRKRCGSSCDRPAMYLIHITLHVSYLESKQTSCINKTCLQIPLPRSVWPFLLVSITINNSSWDRIRNPLNKKLVLQLEYRISIRRVLRSKPTTVSRRYIKTGTTTAEMPSRLS